MGNRLGVLCLATLLAAACGSDSVPEEQPPEPDGGVTPVGGLRFYEDVAPIMMKQCASCHREGGVGPFPLLTYEDAMTIADLIPSKVMTREMPPQNMDNSGDCNTFKDTRWMTDAEIATLVEWANGDRLEGDPDAGPAVPPLPAGLARVDATAAMPTPYTMDPQLEDDYRCFIIDPGIATDGFVTGFEVRPGDPLVVHHVLLFQLSNENAETTAANLDAQTAGPGYTCFGGAGAAASLVAVWAPGEAASKYPETTGLQVLGGRKMVMQVHYHRHPGSPVPTDTTAVDLTLEQTVAQPAFMFFLAAGEIYIPPRQTEFVITNQFQLPGFLGAYNVWGVFPHMHRLGIKQRVEVDHNGQPECFGNVPRWDFNWQQGYFYEGGPKIAGGGDMVRITCTYDSSDKNVPTMGGEGTEDEMCLALLYVSQY